MIRHVNPVRLTLALVALLLAIPVYSQAADGKIRMSNEELRAKAELLPEGGKYLARN